MLQPLRVELPAPPSDRVRVGLFVIDLKSREVLRPGALRGKRLSVKAVQVLIALAMKPGEVLTREELMDSAWPNTYPTGDVLTQAVVQLRRALDDEAETPRYIETISKSGYRLLAAVEWLRFEPANTPGSEHRVGLAPELRRSDTATPAVRTPRSAPRRMLAAIALLVLISASVGAYWIMRTPQPVASVLVEDSPATRPQVMRLTSNPGIEQNPSLSPDGSLLAFSADWGDAGQFAIHVQPSDSFEARRLTSPPTGAGDHAPMWSPDAKQILFRRYQGEETCQLRMVALISGREHELGDCPEHTHAAR
jgi:DNA-binding winged helix-turn-helix (wHTH) protein